MIGESHYTVLENIFLSLDNVNLSKNLIGKIISKNT